MIYNIFFFILCTIIAIDLLSGISLRYLYCAFSSHSQEAKNSLAKHFWHIKPYLTQILISLPLFYLTFIYYGFSIKSALCLFILHSMTLLSLVDYKHGFIPDIIVIPLIIIGFISNYFNLFTDLTDSILGGLFGYTSLYVINLIFKLLRKKEGIGHGDFKLLAATSAILGLHQLPLIILLSSNLAIFSTLIILPFKRLNLSNSIAFGPAIAMAFVISLFWGENIVNAYINFLIKN